jgi:ABC-2 type transport system permease protein
MTATHASEAAGGQLSRALRAEWTKFRTVRSTYWTLIVSAAVTVGLGSAVLAAWLQDYPTMAAAERAAVDPAGEGLWYHGLHLGQVILGVLAALTVTSEYGTGTIRATLAAIPDRRWVLAAKILGTGVLALVVGGAQATAMFVAAQPILARDHLDVPLTDATAWRGVGLAAAATCGVALLGMGTGLLLRHTAGAVTTLLVVMLGLPIVGQFLPDQWQTVTRFLPPEAGWAMFTPTSGELSIPAATAVFAAWVATIVVVAGIAFVHRDA